MTDPEADKHDATYRPPSDPRDYRPTIPPNPGAAALPPPGGFGRPKMVHTIQIEVYVKKDSDTNEWPLLCLEDIASERCKPWRFGVSNARLLLAALKKIGPELFAVKLAEFVEKFKGVKGTPFKGKRNNR